MVWRSYWPGLTRPATSWRSEESRPGRLARGYTGCHFEQGPGGRSATAVPPPGYPRHMVGEGLGRASEMINDGADLGLLLRCERSQAAQPLTEALLDKSSNGDGRDVQSAARRLLRRHAPYALDLAAPAAALIRKAGDERSRRLFVGWCLRPDGRSQAQLGCEEGVSASRVGQIVQSAERQVRAALIESPAPLPWAVRSLRRQLGGVTTGEQLSRALAGLGARKSPAAELLPWLAGPYCAVPRHAGWLAVEPRRPDHQHPGLPGGRRRRPAAGRRKGRPRRPGDRSSPAGLLAPGQRRHGDPRTRRLRWRSPTGRHRTGARRPRCVRGPRSRSPPNWPTGAGRSSPAPWRLHFGSVALPAPENGGIALAAWPVGAAFGDQAAPKSPAHPGSPALRQIENGRRGWSASGSQPAEASASPARFWLWVRVDADVLRGAEAAVPVALMEGLGFAPQPVHVQKPLGPGHAGLRPAPADQGFRPRHRPRRRRPFRRHPVAGLLAVLPGRRGRGPARLGPDRPTGRDQPDVTLFPEVASGGTR